MATVTAAVEIPASAGGPTALFPTRVVPVDDGRSACLFTMFRGPEQSEAEFQAEAESLRRELENIVRRFSVGGEVDRDR